MQKHILYILLLLCGQATLYGQQKEFDKYPPESAYDFDSSDKILSFHSDIVIDTAGRIEVTEHILVQAGYKIDKGIIRNIPVYRKDVFDSKKIVDINVISVLRDGKEEEYTTKNTGDDIEIWIGNPNKYISKTQREYIIKYEALGHIGFFDKFDELYWNITGNGWDFDINEASATITLPDGASIVDTDCYTGRLGSKENRCTVEYISEEQWKFTIVQKLEYYEGFTIAISFTRDIIKRPPPLPFTEQYRQPLIALAGLMIVLLYFLITWRTVGTGPGRPTVIPTFIPPHGWSPAVIRYLYKRRYDNKVFTSALVDMAVKRAIRIKQIANDFTLEITGGSQLLQDEEKYIFDAIFDSAQSVPVISQGFKRFENALIELKRWLDSSWNLKNYVNKNVEFLIIGAIIYLAVMALYIQMTDSMFLLNVLLYASPFIVLALFLVKRISNRRHNASFNIYFPIFGILVCGLFLFGFMRGVFFVNWVTCILTSSIIILYGIYICIMKAPKKAGAQALSDIEGFRMYLKTAEERRLNILTPPQRTPALFEKYLPYAIALDVENEWGEKFNSILLQLNYNPDWYSEDDRYETLDFIDSFSQTFTHSLHNATRLPISSSSSSGSSGRSSSGGGGRGW